MRAALLHGPGDLRVEEVAEPEGEVVVTVEAATSCATDVKCLLYGHRILGPYPARFGHETPMSKAPLAAASGSDRAFARLSTEAALEHAAGVVARAVPLGALAEGWELHVR